MLQLFEISAILTKFGFCATFIINMIFINLTVFYTKSITPTYKRLLVIFATTCIIFSAIDAICQPFIQNYNGGLVYFSLVDQETSIFSQDFLRATLSLNASCYVAQLVFIAIQFLFRYFTLIEHPFRKTFYGISQLIWISYFFFFGALYAIAVHFCLPPDDYSDEYMRVEMIKVYQKDIKGTPRILAVAYQNGMVRWGVVTFFCTGCFIFSLQYLTIIFCTIQMHKSMKSDLANFSTRNKKLEMQFLKALTIQIILPTFLITLPIGFVIMVPLFDINVSCQTGVIFALYSLYPPLDSIATMVIVKEYMTCVQRFWSDLKTFFCNSDKSEEPRNELQLAKLSSIANCQI